MKSREKPGKMASEFAQPIGITTFSEEKQGAHSLPPSHSSDVLGIDRLCQNLSLSEEDMKLAKKAYESLCKQHRVRPRALWVLELFRGLVL